MLVRIRIPVHALLILIVLFAVATISYLLTLTSKLRLSTSEVLFLPPNAQPAPSEITRTSHDDSSLTTYMWHRGEPFNALEAKRPDDSSSLTIDALSIGSKFNVQQMKGQARSWGSHWSIRYLFGTTEQDDADPQCHQKVTEDAFLSFTQFCRTKTYSDSSLKPIRGWFPSTKWLQNSSKTPGWLCAQQRFAHAVGKAGRFYRKEGKLPHFLFIQDDDTWYGMNQMISFLSTRNHSTPFVSAGCRVLWPIQMVNFSFPWGGFGMALNQLSIERLIKPIYCNQTTTTMHNSTADAAHMRRVCLQVDKNYVGEKMAFQDGMSISDLMDRHAAMLPYRNYRQWNNDPGYCMLGDWVLGYYANYYGLGNPIWDENIRQFNQFDHEIDDTLGDVYRAGSRSCKNEDVSLCRKSETKHVCHRITGEDMLSLHQYDANISRSKSLALKSYLPS
jgi:hypothetical protein